MYILLILIREAILNYVQFYSKCTLVCVPKNSNSITMSILASRPRARLLLVATDSGTIINCITRVRVLEYVVALPCTVTPAGMSLCCTRVVLFIFLLDITRVSTGVLEYCIIMQMFELVTVRQSTVRVSCFYYLFSPCLRSLFMTRT